jgi:hypothetical protein
LQAKWSCLSPQSSPPGSDTIGFWRGFFVAARSSLVIFQFTPSTFGTGYLSQQFPHDVAKPHDFAQRVMGTEYF